MTKRLFVVAVAVMVVLAMGATSVTAKVYRNKEQEKREIWQQAYGFTMKGNLRHQAIEGAPVHNSRVAAGGALGVSASPSPGRTIGFTYYDEMHNTTRSRNIDWRYGPQIHMTWIFGSDPAFATRSQAYRAYDPRSGTFGPSGTTPVNMGGARGGYGSIDVLPYDDAGPSGWGSRALVAAHIDRVTPDGDNYYSEVFVQDPDVAPGDFAVNTMPADTNFAYTEPEAVNDTARLIWPVVEHHAFGSDTATYVLCNESDSVTDSLDNNPLVVFRLAGPNPATAAWNNGTVIVNDANGNSQSISASRVSQKVAITWADLRGETVDIWMRRSTDMGLNWNAEENVTNNGPFVSSDSTRTAWAASFCFYDSDDGLHVLWDSHVSASASTLFAPNDILHWYGPTQDISLVYSAQWGTLDAYVPTCVGSYSGVGYAHGYSMSECDSMLYVTWSMANPPQDSTDDCAVTPGLSGTERGNNDIYLSVSSDLTGFGWDRARNLTQSYTPECDTLSGGIQGSCANDAEAVMSRFGQDTSSFGFGLLYANAIEAFGGPDPDPNTYTGDYYLDLIYIADELPGTAIGANAIGVPTRNDVRWLKIPCVDAIVNSDLAFVGSTELGYPSYVNHGSAETTFVRIENRGNKNLEITNIDVNTTSGPVGWLQIDNSPVTVNYGPDRFLNLETIINAGGVVNSPGTIVPLNATIVFTSDDPESPDTFSIVDYLVADTIGEIEYDTIGTGCISIVLANNGDMGAGGGLADTTPGATDSGRTNMDFFACGECDTFYDSLPGDASVYLYDASPLIYRYTVDGMDTTLIPSYSIFSNGLASEEGYRPVLDATPSGFSSEAAFDVYTSGTFVSADSAIGVEVYTYAPTGVNANYLIQAHKIFSYDKASHDNLVIGNAIDWDIPSDSGVNNVAGQNPFAHIVYLQGGEFDFDTLDCQSNDARFGACALIGWVELSDTLTFHGEDEYHNIFTGLNDDLLLGGGFDEPVVFDRMVNETGLVTVDPSVIDDQAQILTIFDDYDLSGGQQLIIYYAYATVQNGTDTDVETAITDARDFYQDNKDDIIFPEQTACCGEYTGGVTGNVDDDTGGIVDLGDLLYMANAVFLGGPAIACPAKGNTDGDPGCIVDLGDILWLAGAVFLGGSPNAACDPACEL